MVILNLGGIIQAIRVPDFAGEVTDVCLGFDSVEEYENSNDYIGAMIGRYANRIGGGRFTLGDTDYKLVCNDGPNHLHGGAKGFDRYVCEYHIGDEELVLSRISADGEEGYPGNLFVRFGYRLTNDNQLILEYNAEADTDSLVNLTNHAYFNLDGENSESILDHTLTLYSSRYSENDGNCLPTGRLLPVDDSPFDFRTPKRIGRDIDARHVQISNGKGYDHNFVLDSGNTLKPAGVLVGGRSGIVMEMHTTKPCLQFYSGNSLSGESGRSGIHNRRAALCLEAQYTPNDLDNSKSPSPFIKKGERYSHRTIYRFKSK